MDTGDVVTVRIEFEVGSEPLRGRLQSDDGQQLDFFGVLELLAVLDELRDTAQWPDVRAL